MLNFMKLQIKNFEYMQQTFSVQDKMDHGTHILIETDERKNDGRGFLLIVDVED